MQGFHSFFSEGAVAAANGAARAQEGNADGGGAWRRCAAALDGQEALAAEDHQTRLLRVLCVQEFALDADHSAAALLLRLHLGGRGNQNAGELARVCRPGGRIVIPTYMNETARGTTNPVSSVIGRAGVDFKREFTPESYRRFFAAAGYADVRYTLCPGRIPCSVAVIRKPGGENF